MKAVDHASFSTIRKFVRDVLGEKVSRGYLRKIGSSPFSQDQKGRGSNASDR
jgi:hypothetical protein